MEYAIGQNVIHPAHGPGEVVDIEQQELTEGDEQYCVLHFADKRLTVRVPLLRCEEVGLRRIMSQDKSRQVMATLRQLPQRLPADFKQRHKQIEGLIYSGAPVKVAEAVRELSWRRVHNKYLGIADQRLLREGKDLLIQELALATKKETSQIETDVDAALAVAIEAKEADVKDIALKEAALEAESAEADSTEENDVAEANLSEGNNSEGNSSEGNSSE